MTLKRHLDLLALSLGIAAVLVGGAAIVGYSFSLPGLLRPTPDTPAIVFSAALALMAGGIAVIAAALAPSAGLRRISGFSGTIAGVLGLAGLVERLLGTDLAIDLPALHTALGLGGATPGRMVPTAGLCFAVLGASLAALPFIQRRRAAIALTAATTVCGAFGAMSLTGYLLNVEFLVSWPSDSPLPPNTALGLALLGAGACSAVLRRTTLSAGMIPESRNIELTAVWVLSVIAVVAGVSTFALAQYEYHDVVRVDLARTLRERRAFLEYAIREHLTQVTLGAHPAFAASAGARQRGIGNDAMHGRLQASADILTQTSFSGWQFAVDGATITSGKFVEHPDFTISLSGPYHTDLLLKDGSYFLRTRIPMRDGEREVGFAIAEDPFPELTRLKLETDSWRETGSMVLCAARDNALDCFPSRANPNGARIPREVNGRPIPSSLAVDREVGVYETLDFRQRRVLAAYGPVGFTGLGMVIKIDAAELNAPLGRRFSRAAVLLAALVAAGVWLLRRRLRPLTNALVDAREEATRVAAQFKAAAESSLDAYFLMDAVRDQRQKVVDFCIRYTNASGEVLIGRPAEDIIGKRLREILSSEQARYFIERYERIVTTGESLSEEFRTSADDASASWVAHQAVRLNDGVSVTARDITLLKNTERQLRSKAENDVLTGLPNRALFFDRLSRALADGRQSSSGVAVLFLDIDRFKQVNDRHGHAVGDAVLVEFADRLRKLVRATDTVARLGGDEFAIILPKLVDIAQAERVAADILSAIGVPFVTTSTRLEIGTSIGVAFSSDGHNTPEALVSGADRKLYQAKSGGRGRFSSATEKRAA
ncbi:MAG: diguanylate cyclase [Betaproteobacteria bacterium]